MSTLYYQYRQLQEKYSDCVVLVSLGDFFEVLGDNAKTVAKELDITLTSRDCGLDTRVPMCGFPYHLKDKYIAMLVDKGYKIAIVEELTR